MQLFEKADNHFLAIGDLVNLKILSKQVFTFAQSCEHTLIMSMQMTICVLYNASQAQKGTEKGIVVLTKIGEAFSEVFSDSNISLVLEEIKINYFGIIRQ